MEELFEVFFYYGSNLYYGFRIVFDENGYVFVLFGDCFYYGVVSSLLDVN